MTVTETSRHVEAPPAVVYRILLDPAALPSWRVPDGMSAEVHEFEPREGGRFRVSLTYDAPDGSGKTSATTDTYHGHFRELVPGAKVVEVLEFETTEPSLQGEMTMTTTLTPAGAGTEVTVTHEGLPSGVAPQDNETGTRMALDNLARLASQRAATT